MDIFQLTKEEKELILKHRQEKNKLELIWDDGKYNNHMKFDKQEETINLRTVAAAKHGYSQNGFFSFVFDYHRALDLNRYLEGFIYEYEKKKGIDR